MTLVFARRLSMVAGFAVVMLGASRIAAEEPVEPVFTAEQANAGRLAYSKNCASCHMPDLTGDNERPPLAGQAFMATWGGRSIRELLEYMSGAMPYGAPALDPDGYKSITAFILRSNGATPGTQPLSASTDVSIARVTGQVTK